jgi:hypothetical protein
MPVALPASLVCGLVFGLGQAQRRVRVAVVALALAASSASWYLVAFAAPASNQLYREAFVGWDGGPHRPFRGVNELTLGEIRQLRAEPTIMPGTFPISMTQLARAYHMRLALTASPLVFALAILSMTRGRRWVDAGIGAGVVVGYLAGFIWSPPGYQASVAAAWAPNVILMVVATGVVITRRQRARGRAKGGDLLLD